jgi:divalent metal cation (Fe/Co/Zn/Cd) transporter
MYIGPNKLLVNMEVNLKNGLTTDDIEELIDVIKARVKKEVPSVGHIQIELESE